MSVCPAHGEYLSIDNHPAGTDYCPACESGDAPDPEQVLFVLAELVELRVLLNTHQQDSGVDYKTWMEQRVKWLRDETAAWNAAQLIANLHSGRKRENG